MVNVLTTASTAAASTSAKPVRMGPALTKMAGKKLGISSAARMNTAFIGMNCAKVPVMSEIMVKTPAVNHLTRVGGWFVGFMTPAKS